MSFEEVWAATVTNANSFDLFGRAASKLEWVFTWCARLLGSRVLGCLRVASCVTNAHMPGLSSCKPAAGEPAAGLWRRQD